MQNELCIHFMDLWNSKRSKDRFPKISDFSEQELAYYDGQTQVIYMEDAGLYYKSVGHRLQQVASHDLLHSEIFDHYPAAIQDMQRDLIRFALIYQLGINRLSRYWYGHRHKDIELLLLPVFDDSGRVCLMGVAASFIASSDQDTIDKQSNEVERIVAQEYLTFGAAISIQNLSAAAQSFLATMGTIVSVDGQEKQLQRSVAIGGAADAAARAARPSVLIVSEREELIPYIDRFTARYRLKVVETTLEAAEILTLDKIDILIVSEKIPDQTKGIDLVRKFASITDEVGLIMLLESREGAEDQVLTVCSTEVHCLVKPVGEFALKRAIDGSYKTIKSRTRARHVG